MCRYVSLLVAALGTMALGGCVSGTTKIDETYLLRASNGGDQVYYRVVISGQTELGVTDFRQGWYPASAVDALFGEVSAEGGATALTAREDIRKEIDAALLRAYKNYLSLVTKTGKETPSSAELAAAREAIRNVRLLPGGRGTVPNVVEAEYDPARDLIVARSGQKLVLVLSSDPDEVIGRIAELAEDAKTEQVVSKLTSVIAAREIESVQGVRAETNQIRTDDATLTRAMARLRDRAGNAPATELRGEIAALVRTIEGVSR